MRTIATISELRAALAEPRRAGRTIGLVPTMGAFHDGHRSLMRRAREQCDEVVVSLFVNPTQFNDPRDLIAYPADAGRDGALAAASGVDYLFVPPAAEVYPAGFATTVSVGRVTEPLEGAHRGREHFDGVTTVVAKLLNMVQPAVAYFGQKDAQQVAVIRQFVGDLNVPVRIEVCPTVREGDGLAMSSRNVHLSPLDRRRATALHRALSEIATAIAAGERDPAAALAQGRAELAAVQIAPDYLELVDADTLAPAHRIEGQLLAVVAARVGEIRLIDNQPIRTVSTADGSEAAASPEGRRHGHPATAAELA